MNQDMKLYYDYTVSPLGNLFYKTLWHQLKDIEDKKVLDFGSGFAFTTNFLAQHNDVTAIELDKSMIDNRVHHTDYTQLHGDLNQVKHFADETFDVIICHLVLEFVDNPQLILNELNRVLKKGGTLSIVRHNKNGRIVQAIVQDNDLDDAKQLLEGGYSYSSAFGDIKYYTTNDLLALLPNQFKVDKIYGIRSLASLHSSTIQSTDSWTENMLEIEQLLMTNQDFINIAYFNHILLIK